MGRIEDKFQNLKTNGRKAFIAYIMAGDPDFGTTEKLVLELEKQGVDLIELGVPFSDPLADGPTIQAAGQRALASGTTLSGILDLVYKVRNKVQIPIILMSYFNPIYHYGVSDFLHDAKLKGVDGLIIPDLALEESKETVDLAEKNGIDLIFLIAPTSSLERIKKISDISSGFIYYVSLTGVTGVRESLVKEVGQFVNKIKKFTKKPVCVGFGVSTKEQVKELLKYSDGVIVGSAIVKKVEEGRDEKDIVKKTSEFVKALVSSAREK
ncbi:MAG: tryptophan synthase subunit alpha [bacterium]|nr:tryptophan synthase subunit alpha [bacterium]